MTKKILCLLLAVIMILATVACAAKTASTEQTEVKETPDKTSSEEEKVEGPTAETADEPTFEEQTIILNFDQAETSNMGLGVAKFKELVEAATDGKVVVETYYNGSLFNQSQLRTPPGEITSTGEIEQRFRLD